MVDSAAHLVDEVLPKRPIRQWVLSVPYPLRYLFATNPKVMSQVLTIVHRVISTFLIKRARMTVKSGAQSGAVTLIQRFGSALNLNPHFHMLYLNGVYDAKGYFWPVKPQNKGHDKRHKMAEQAASRNDLVAPLTWAQRLKRVFNIDITLCPLCGGAMRVIADITDPDIIQKILDHIEAQPPPVESATTIQSKNMPG